MTTVACPKCTQPLDISGLAPGTVVQCICGAKLRTPKPPSAAQAPAGQAPVGQTPIGPAPAAQSPSQPVQSQAPMQPLGQADPLASPTPGNTDPLFDPALMASIPSPQQPANLHPGQPYAAPGQPYQAAGQPYQAAGQPYPAAGQTAPAQATPQNLNEKQQLAYVNQGVQLVFWGYITQIVAGLAMSLFMGFGQEFFSLASFGGTIAVLVGYVFSLYAPKESDSRKYIIAALSCIGLSVGGFVFSIFVILFSSLLLGVILLVLVMLLSFFLSFASVVLYLYFLKTLADYTKQPQAADEAQTLAIQLMIMVGAGFVLGILFMLMPRQAALVIGVIAGLGFSIAQLFWLISFLQFLERLEFRKRKKRKIGASTSGWGSHR